MPEPWRALTDVALGGWSPTGRARVVQLALAGRWEEAQPMALPADPAAVRGLVERAASDAAADVAVEVEWLGRPLVFVGARRRPSGDPVFAEHAIRTALGDPEEAQDALAGLAGGAPAGLAAIELGAANAWRSVGPLRLWSPAEPWAPEALPRRLSGHPALEHCHVPVALEVAFGGPRECWIGVEVSRPEGRGHRVRASRVQTLVSELLAVAVA